MCGIAGIIGASTPNNTNNELKINTMLDQIFYRGPDQRGVWLDNYVALGHLRLSILDIEGGLQPMQFDSSIVLIYNGEIYNAPELRKELVDAGQKFVSDHSDTEVIYRGYQSFGLNYFKKLEGMFAIAIYDKKVKCLYLVRDRSGIKPIYYQVNLGQVLFASEPKCFEGCGLKKDITKEKLIEYFTFRTCLAPNTFFKDICKVRPGELIEINVDTQKVSVIDNLNNDIEWKIRPSGDRYEINNLESAIDASIKRQVVADVKIGIYLSGGIDSSIIAALASKHGVKDAFTISTNSGFDESEYAKKVADKFGLNLNILNIDNKDFINNLEDWTLVNDDPIADPSALALMILSKYAASKGCKVMLAGDGADELFGGYNAHLRFLAAKSIRNIFPKFITKKMVNTGDPRFNEYMMQKELRYLGSAHPVDSHLLKEIFDFNNDFINNEYLYSNYNSNSNSSNHWLEIDRLYRLADDILPRTDRASMFASIEARVPFLDEHVLRQAMIIPDFERFGSFNMERKVVLKKIALRLGVPSECVNRKKLGFELPIEDWLKNEFSEIVTKKLISKNISEINYDAVGKIYKLLGSKRSHRLSVGFLWHWLTLELWYEKWGCK
jgi:asparagine synthase (glutamine-hydrolysing)